MGHGKEQAKGIHHATIYWFTAQHVAVSKYIHFLWSRFQASTAGWI